MSRLRYNNAVGLLGSGLTGGGTTISFGAVPPFSTITGSDYIPLVLEPSVGYVPSSNFEVVYLTAYTAGQTTGTILRGQEGTSGVPHSNGVLWTCVPTKADFPSAAARVVLSASQSIANGSFQIVSWASADYNIGTLWVGGQPTRLTAPVAGIYTMNATHVWTASATAARAGFFSVNGAGVGTAGGYQINAAGGNTEMSWGDIRLLAAGDYVEAGAYQNTGGALNLIPNNVAKTMFAMALVQVM